MSYSPLVSYYVKSPNYDPRGKHKIKGFAIHCFPGQITVKRGVDAFSYPRDASANYVVGYDGQIGCAVDEENRAWTTSTDLDFDLITVEMATDSFHPYAVNSQAYEGLIKLLVDCCKRNGIKRLAWAADKEYARQFKLSEDYQNMVAHRWFANKACVPTSSEVLTKEGWKRIDEIEIGEEIACADLDRMRITFEEVYDTVPVRIQDTYTSNGLTATKDHRMVWRTQHNEIWRVDQFKYLLDSGRNIFIPKAGQAEFDGLMLSDDMIRFLVAVQADGHYMHEKRVDGSECYFGIEFHFKKDRKIERLKEILEHLHFEYKETKQADGTTKIRLYGADYHDICEQFLEEKRFTWKWIFLSPDQAKVFLEEVILWDGSTINHAYFSRDRQNLDVACAIAALNGKSACVKGDICTFNIPYQTIVKEAKRNRQQEVTCVSVKTGLFLIRQNGDTFIVGNCPGDWIYNREGEIAAEVNKRLGQPSPDPDPPKPEPPEPEPEYTTTIVIPNLSNGDEGADVASVQGALEYHGYDLEPYGGCDGIFGDATEDAVIKFQKVNGLDPDGVVGAKTYSALHIGKVKT